MPAVCAIWDQTSIQAARLRPSASCRNAKIVPSGFQPPTHILYLMPAICNDYISQSGAFSLQFYESRVFSQGGKKNLQTMGGRCWHVQMFTFSDAHFTHFTQWFAFRFLYCLDALHSFGRQILLWPVQTGLKNQCACVRFAKKTTLRLQLRWSRTDRLSEVDLSENDGVSFGSVSGRTYDQYGGAACSTLFTAPFMPFFFL